jgi:TRAP-type C4-dicarboxylate transport system permease large subunit
VPFVVALLILLALLVAFPELSLFLPRMVMG